MRKHEMQKFSKEMKIQNLNIKKYKFEIMTQMIATKTTKNNKLKINKGNQAFNYKGVNEDFSGQGRRN